MDRPCAAAVLAVVVRLETSEPSIIGQVPELERFRATWTSGSREENASQREIMHTIWYRRPAVANMNGAADSLSQERLEPGEQRVLAVEHIVQRHHRHGLGAVLAQEAAERVELARWAVQRKHARRGRAAERGDHAETLMRLGEQRIVAAGEAGAHLAVLAGAGPRGDVVEDHARGLAGAGRPVG
ncbi:hypothetical protein chiPu_0032034, partial [Chiloscyllium punctatum]|nr:hypothetical protein [Chiloscyllium punctatum]